MRKADPWWQRRGDDSEKVPTSKIGLVFAMSPIGHHEEDDDFNVTP